MKNIRIQQDIAQLMILSVLAHNNKMSSYSIGEEINQKGKGGFVIKPVTIYCALTRLENKGMISVCEETTEKRTRVYYILENKGKEYFQSLKRDYLSMLRGTLDVLDVKNIYQAE